MRLLLLISLATIPLAGCQFFGGGDQPVADLIETVEQDDGLGAAPTIPAVTNGGEASSPGEGSQAFEEPTVVAAQPTAASADLIQATDPTARTRQISRSRVDPFASLPIPPAPTPIAVTPVAAVGNQSASGGGSSTASAQTTGGSTATARVANAPIRPPTRVQPNNAPLVVPSPIVALPRIPQPVIAPTVLVSGVVQLGNEPYAIVRAGNEPERYVRVGDRIAGGSVRVKRIETLAFEPRVILEENGIEVARPIESGEIVAPITEPASDSAAAVLPNFPVSMPPV